MRTKITINVERGSSYDFQLSDEITCWGIPYIIFLHQNFIDFVSPITNKIVRTIDFGAQLIASN